MNSKIFSKINEIILNKLPTSLRMKIYVYLSNKNINKNSFIGPNCIIHDIKRIELEKGANVNQFCKFLTSNKGRVSIGKNSWIGCNVSFVCITHKIGKEEKRAGETMFKSILIEDGVWIGANVTILPGVEIKKGCIIGAGSVVIKSTEKECMQVILLEE